MMKAMWAGIFALAVLTAALHAETADSSSTKASTAPAHLKQESTTPTEALKPMVESIPEKALNPHSAKKATNTSTPTEEMTTADMVLRHEQKDWLAVGVMKLSGKYQPDSDLSAEEEEELEEKRLSFYSPTMFVDHFARLERANGGESTTPINDWSQIFHEPVLDRTLDLSMDSAQVHMTTPEPAKTRVNPYMVGLQPKQSSPVIAEVLTPQWTDNTAAPQSNWQQSLGGDTTRSRPLLVGETESILPQSANLASPAPTSTPSEATNRRKKDVSEKYFRNLDRF
ncbi:hypothetical protein [Cerasicoccus arenae]|uniref:Secreted protein n=1 Tax=Cerasicoccus arenae TaxID=424488 RepID=A0A8J3DGH9_9BACT|nr:hypothetical protein [Cerasicoccus arenae]MBK1856690.1 hypothetical protein [Cerasicoccus arenae]GHB98930.1 hypothetical protein GCM10007047_13710 [Cerasicoccus arenae]